MKETKYTQLTYGHRLVYGRDHMLSVTAWTLVSLVKETNCRRVQDPLDGDTREPPRGLGKTTPRRTKYLPPNEFSWEIFHIIRSQMEKFCMELNFPSSSSPHPSRVPTFIFPCDLWPFFQAGVSSCFLTCRPVMSKGQLDHFNIID